MSGQHACRPSRSSGPSQTRIQSYTIRWWQRLQSAAHSGQHRRARSQSLCEEDYSAAMPRARPEQKHITAVLCFHYM